VAACGCGGIQPDDPRFRELDAFIDAHRHVRGSLIGVLHRAQELFGFLPEEVQQHVAQRLGIPPSQVYGVVTFYNYFNLRPTGRYTIRVCMGTACYVRGADKVLQAIQSELKIQPGEMTSDGLFSLEVCRCIGCCGLAPAIMVGEEVFGNMTDAKVPEVLARFRQQAQGGEPEPAVAAGKEGAR